MKPLFDCASSRDLDAKTRKNLGISELQLMEKASIRLWDAIRPRFPNLHAPIAAVCGKGDNGADALAMLRHAASSGFDCLSALVSRKKPSESHAAQLKSLEAMGVEILYWLPENLAKIDEAFGKASLVLDGIAGTGVSGELKEESRDMVCSLNSARLRNPSLTIASIDLPSGLSDEWRPGWACVKADLTLALEPAKAICFDPEARIACGELLPVRDVFPLGLLAENPGLSLIDWESLESDPFPIAPRDYKMSRGKLAIYAGSENSIGAAILCAKAASAAGAGYVTLYVDDSIHGKVSKALESFVVKIFRPGKEPEPCDLLLVGPGWGRGEDREAQLAVLLAQGIPSVLDADALRLVARNPTILAPVFDRCALTPHPGELKALLEALGLYGSTFLRSILEASEKLRSILVAKAHVTWASDARGNACVWDGMQPELGTSGTGDILAGLLAGFAAGSLARRSRGNLPGEDEGIREILYDAAIRAVAVHGRAGKKTAEDKGWFEATDILPECARLSHELSLKRGERR
jgi:NAD(P)H-hydrate epimerase